MLAFGVSGGWWGWADGQPGCGSGDGSELAVLWDTRRCAPRRSRECAQSSFSCASGSTSSAASCSPSMGASSGRSMPGIGATRRSAWPSYNGTSTARSRAICGTWSARTRRRRAPRGRAPKPSARRSRRLSSAAHSDPAVRATRTGGRSDRALPTERPLAAQSP